ncbi:MAG: hypothetical protein PHH93_05130 [Prolixibacteraceae bacterium]|nr:hypothetical protein [Prolixibacteraceae bacterium]
MQTEEQPHLHQPVDETETITAGTIIYDDNRPFSYRNSGLESITDLTLNYRMNGTKNSSIIALQVKNIIDFKENLDGIVSILKREHLHPIDIKIWEKEVGKKLKAVKKEEEESRTKHLLKIGRILDIKYTKTEK